MISMTAGLPVCAPSADGERVDSGGALRATTLPWRPRRRFIPTIANVFRSDLKLPCAAPSFSTFPKFPRRTAPPGFCHVDAGRRRSTHFDTPTICACKHVEDTMTANCWRIRCRNASGVDQTKAAWSRGEIGLWYGAWSAGDWNAALSAYPTNPKQYLDQLEVQRRLWPVSKQWVDTTRRFCGITDTDYVVVFFDGALHFGRVTSELRSDNEHPLNCGAELFKFRTVSIRGEPFALDQLPDAFRLLPSAGRGNVFQYQDANQQLVELLRESARHEE